MVAVASAGAANWREDVEASIFCSSRPLARFWGASSGGALVGPRPSTGSIGASVSKVPALSSQPWALRTGRASSGPQTFARIFSPDRSRVISLAGAILGVVEDIKRADLQVARVGGDPVRS